MTLRRLVIVAAVSLCIPSTMGGGCGTTPLPPAEAVLAGGWRMASQDTGQDGKLFVFDSDGHLLEIHNAIGNATYIDRDVHDSTRVTGSNVFIRTTGGLIFEGTLNDTQNIITGRLRSEIDVIFSNDIIVTDLGEATLTKQ